MEFNDFLRRFEHPKQIKTARGCKSTYITRCPAHNDKVASLSISESNEGKILLNCHANCDADEILNRVGLSWKDLSNRKELTWHQKKAWGLSQELGGEWKCIAEYPYKDENGKYLYSKVRFENESGRKEIRYYQVDNVNDVAVAGKGDNESVLYRLPEFLELRKKAQYVYIVEGEKDVETLKRLKGGFGCAITCGGAGDWRKEFARCFKGLKVIILRDNDNAGLTYAEEVKRDLLNYAHFVKVVNPSNLEHGDVTDFIKKEGGNAESLTRKCDEVVFSPAKWVEVSDKGKDKINAGILAEVIAENEPYIIIRNPKDDRDRLFIFEHGVYHEKNKPAVQKMIAEYIPASRRTSAILDNVYKLIFANAEKVYTPNQLNTDDRYINFQNGLYDIESKKLVAHKPDVLSTFQYQFNYDESAKSMKNFEKFINDFCRMPNDEVDEDRVKVIQEMFGFILGNQPIKKIKRAFVFWSRCGNTGKSTLIRLLTWFYGVDRVSAVKLTEMTADNRFILGSLPDSRLIICGDESSSDVRDSGIFKSLTGGDGVKVERKGKEGYTHYFKGVIVIACNELPYFHNDYGDHLFKRLLIFPCEHFINDTEKISDIDEKMKKEMSAIFNWSLVGLYRLIENNYCFSKSDAIDDAMEEYRQKKDNVYRFVIEHYVITHAYSDTIGASDFANSYHSWALENPSVKEVDRKNLSARLESMGIIKALGNVNERHHVTIYRGIKEKESEFVDANQVDMKLPIDD